MQLKLALAALAALCIAPSGAWADAEIAVTGAYYKERSTRVMQPMIDARLDVGEHGELRSHVLVDSITSASPASGASGVAFTERRYETGATYLHTLGIAQIGGGFRYSDEPDYRSIFATVRGAVELASRNTTIAASLSRGFDEISNAGARGGMAQEISGDMDTTLTSLSLTQILAPTILAQVTYDFSYIEGFQENAYRQVAAAGVLVAERVPDERFRHAVFAAGRLYVPSSNTAIVAGYRLYIDDWGILGHTPEARVVQRLGDQVHASLRYRFHSQGAADFYRKVYDSSDPSVEPYLTADPKLGALTTHSLSGRLEFGLHHLGLSGRLGRSRATATLEYFAQSSRFGDAIISNLGLEVPFSY